MINEKGDITYNVKEMKTIKLQKKFIVIILLLIVTIFIIYKLSQSYTSKLGLSCPTINRLRLQKQRNKHYSVWLPFSPVLQHQQKWYETTCFSGNSLNNIDKLTDILKIWQKSSNEECKLLYTKFNSIYSVERKIGNIVIPETMMPKVKSWLGNNAKLIEQIKSQPVTHIYNEFTREHTVYNPLRAKRPLKPPDADSEIRLDKLSNDTRENCDFCNYAKMMARDEFGRLETKLSATAANSFKFDQWHELIFPKSHHPVKFTEDQVQDLFLLSKKWFSKIHSLDQNFSFPTLVWDTTYKAGASQIHPHIHATIDSNKYWGGLENQRLAAEQYYEENNHVNYFSDLTAIHNALGLVTSLDDAVAIIPLTSRKDYEVFILSKTPSISFFRLLYISIRLFFEEIHQNCFSMGMIFPELSESENPPGNMPALARITPRGDPLDIRSDLSSLELFSGSNVNVDLFLFSKQLRKMVEKYNPSS